MKDAITIIRNNKLRTIIEMKEKIVDFVVVNTSPWITGKFKFKQVFFSIKKLIKYGYPKKNRPIQVR